MILNDFLLFKWRKDLLKGLIEEEGDYYFTRIEGMGSSYCRILYLQVVKEAKESIFEFISYVHGNYNLFSKRNSVLTGEKIRAIYRYICIYNTINFLNNDNQNDNHEKYRDEIVTAITQGFSSGALENACFEMYYAKSAEDMVLFEMEFTNDFTRDIFENEKASPSLLAFIANFFYNSYNNFMLSCEMYTA